MFSPCSGEVGPRTPEKRWAEIPHALKLHGENVLNRPYSAVDYSTSLQFSTYFKRMTPEVQVNVSKIKVTA